VTPPESNPREEVELLREIAAISRKQLETLVVIGQAQLVQAAIEAEVLSTLSDFYTAWQAANQPESPAVRGVLTLSEGVTSMGLTVDTTPGQESVTYGFEDDKGNATGAPTGDGSGIAVAFTSTDDTLATVGAAVPGTDAAGNATLVAPITVVSAVPNATGVGFAGTASNTSGAPLLDDDGVTAWEDPAPTALIPITAGDPVEGTLSAATS
jgi:hypothetical protein